MLTGRLIDKQWSMGLKERKVATEQGATRNEGQGALRGVPLDLTLSQAPGRNTTVVSSRFIVLTLLSDLIKLFLAVGRLSRRDVRDGDAELHFPV